MITCILFNDSYEFYSISQLVGDLLSCNDGLLQPDTAFKSLQEATDEVHLLLKEPTGLLFQREHPSKHILTIGSRLVGRSTEASNIIDAYNRVVSTGRSEVVVIGGRSGSGKTALVKKAVGSLKLSEGYFVERKFEETSTQSCMIVILSAFNEMLFQITQTKPMELLNAIYTSLVTEFGPSYQSLARILPNVLLLHSYEAHPFNYQIDSNVNFLSLCFTLQRFMKIISAFAGPGIIFLDGESCILSTYCKF